MRALVGRTTRSPAVLKSILFVAAALRAPLTVVGPMTDVIRTTFHLGATEAGLLTTLPLLAFAIVSPFATLLCRCGLKNALFGAMLLTAVGIILRSAGSALLLYTGTCLIGCGIAIGNVLLPSLTRREFPEQIASLTAMYAVIMSVAAACASVAAIPLGHALGLGWSFALSATVVLPLFSMVWILKLNDQPRAVDLTPQAERSCHILSSMLAWQVTLFLGLNSLVFYVTLIWLPSILAERGYSPQQAGSLHGLMQIAGAIPALGLIPFINRTHHHKIAAAAASLFSAAGLAGLALEPDLAALWTLLLGCGMGAAMILGLAFLGLRASSPGLSAALSGMAQGVGYGLAAAGPPLIGALRELLNSWTVPLLCCAGVCVLMSILGSFAGRSVTIVTK
jgi:MFS transporter, CP family, cyanate transporter